MQVPQAPVPCSKPWPQGGLGQGWEGCRRVLPAPAVALLYEELGAQKSTRTKWGMTFFAAVIQALPFWELRVPFLCFLLTVLKLCFFGGTLSLPLKEKEDLVVVQIVPYTWGLMCSSVVTADVVWFGGYYFGDCSFFELCNHREAAFDLLSI